MMNSFSKCEKFYKNDVKFYAEEFFKKSKLKIFTQICKPKPDQLNDFKYEENLSQQPFVIL